MTDSSTGYTFYGRYFTPSDTEGGDVSDSFTVLPGEDSFDFSNLTTDDGAEAAGNGHFWVFHSATSEVTIDNALELNTAAPDEGPFGPIAQSYVHAEANALDEPTDTTFDFDFIA